MARSSTKIKRLRHRWALKKKRREERKKTAPQQASGTRAKTVKSTSE